MRPTLALRRCSKMGLFLQVSLILITATQISGCWKAPGEHNHQVKSMGKTLTSGEDNPNGPQFTPVTPGAQFKFPRDHLSHQDFRQEWWYLTANLTTPSGEQLGAQWTQFRVALAPNKASPKHIAKRNESSWATEQVYFAHSALTTASTHYAYEKWSRSHAAFADVSADPLQIYIDNWRWQSESDALFPAKLTVDNPDFSYQLTLNSHAPLQYQGNNGYSVKSRDGKVASYYYSQPFIKITGEINRHGKVERVSGHGWLDREWSSQFLTKTQQGWDWFALRLNDGSALMLFQLRDQDTANSVNQNASSAFYSARRMFADGTGRNIETSKTVGSTLTELAIQMTPLTWQQTAQGRYPTRWQLSIPSENIHVTISALNPNSAMPFALAYWEGPITISGSHTGTGFMELTGY